MYITLKEKTAAKLKNILCNNKSKLLPNSYPGVYELSCDCGGEYIGETKKRMLTRSIEHQEDGRKMGSVGCN